jgi:hypothetical protein
MNGKAYYARYLEVKKQFGLSGPTLLKQGSDPLHWSNWYRWFHHNGFDEACARMAKRDEYTVPCLDVAMFDPDFDPEAHPVSPDWARPEPAEEGDDPIDVMAILDKAISRAMTPEAMARCAEMYRKFQAGIPVNEAVAHTWAKMAPYWRSGNPAYAGLTKTPPTPPPKSEAERMADLLAKANEPIEASPALLRALEAKQKTEEDHHAEPGRNDGQGT